MSWVIKIEAPTPSLNEWQRMHWREQYRLKETFRWLLASALNKQPKIPNACGRRKLVIERHGKKAMDLDNLAAGCKALIDCVKEQRLIQDDSPAHCDLEFRQVVRKKDGPHTVLYLSEVA